MNNRLVKLFQDKHEDILNVYCTAGFPNLHDTPTVIEGLAKAGVDIVEIGMPFSDPIADGPTIQASNQQALENGMNLELLFEQLENIREKVDIPLILMGYINPVIQYGIEKFCKKASEIGIDGFILPDIPIREYELNYKTLFEHYGISNIFLITPQTSEERIKKIDALTNGFIYMVSTDSTTGKTRDISESQMNYFQRIAALELKNPRLIGFGIHDHATYSTASQYANGVIIGSAFIKAIANHNDLGKASFDFVRMIKNDGVKEEA